MGDKTRSETINTQLASCSNSRVHSDDTGDIMNDEEGFQRNTLTSEVTCLHQLEQTDVVKTTSTSSSSSSAAAAAAAAAIVSSSLLQQPIKDDIATVQLNAHNLDQIVTPACEHTPATETNTKITPSSSLSSVGSQMKFFEKNDCGLEEYCLQQWDRTIASMREDTVLSVTEPETSSSSSSSSSSLLSSLPSCNRNLKSSESQRSDAESADSEVLSDKQPQDNDLRDTYRSCSVRTASLAPVSRDPSVVDRIKDAADLSENCLISQISDLQQMNDSKTDTSLAEQPLMRELSITEQTPPITSLIGFKDDKELNTVSTEYTMLEETEVEQTEDERKCVDVSRKEPVTERDEGEMVQGKVVGEGMNVYALQLSPPLSQFIQSSGGENLDRSCNDGLQLKGDTTGTESQHVDSSSKTFTTISTMYFQPSTAKDQSAVCTTNSSNSSDARTGQILPSEKTEEFRSRSVEDRFVDTSSDLPVASSKTKGLVVECKCVSKKSKNHETEECTSTSVEDRSVTACMNDIVSVDVPSDASSRVNDPRATTDGKVITKESSENPGGIRSPFTSNGVTSYRSSLSLVVKQPALTVQTSSNNSNSSFIQIRAKSPTTVSALENQERGCAVETVASKSSNGPSSAAASETNGSNNSSERKTIHPHVLPTTINNTNHSSVEELARSLARRKLQSLLAPKCGNAGLPSIGRKSPVVNRNAVKVELAADSRETKSPPSDDFGLLSTKDESMKENAGDYRGRLISSLPRTIVRQPITTSSQTTGFLDDNNNNKQVAVRDVIKMGSPSTRRSRGAAPSSWQRKQVPATVRSFSHLSTADDQNNQRNRTNQNDLEDCGHRDVTTVGTFPLNRTSVVFQRSLSLPVVDRSEEFLVPSTSAVDRDRLKLPQTPHRSSILSPPTSLKS